MSEISTLGEFGLIKRLTEGIELKNKSSIYGVGDDCAILDYRDRQMLLTTDMLMEGVHFDRTYTPLQHLGYKSAMVNFSDVYAMGGTPRQITVSIAIDKRFSVEDMDLFYSGLRIACEEHGVDIVGGDTTSSLTGFAISITCVGDVEAGKAIKRNGAKDTDIICVSGNLGAAYMGLQLLKREQAVFEQQWREMEALQGEQREAMRRELENYQPDMAGREYIIERQLRPEARRDVIKELHERGVQPTAMMDVSDGLSSELLHICSQSNCGCRVFEERIPIDYQTAVMAEELNMNVTTCALNGGEDYELVFTVPITDHEKISNMKDVKMIGHITRKELGCILVTRDSQEFELKAQGWNPLKKE